MKRKVNRSIKLAGLLVTGLLIAQVLSACSNSAEPTSTPVPVTTQAAASPVTTGAPATNQPATATPTAQPASVTTASRPAPTATPSVAAVPPEIKSVTPDASQIGRYNKLELTVDLKASYNNPFDPAQVDLHAVFTAPGGSSKVVPGFYWQDYTSQLSNQKEVLTPRGQAAWKVRFSPDSEGEWTYYVEVVTPGGTARTDPAKVKVVSSTNPGFLRVSSQDNSYLEFSNGQPYFAVGQNVGWYGEGGSHDYARWFQQMASNGANYARIWMASWAMGIEWSDAPLGDYTKRLDRAWQMDQVFDLAEQDNIYIVLSLLNHGAFSKTTNSEWNKNPYNAALGGPCAEPEDFATNPQARELFKRRLRYIVARWGYSSHLLAWEWWNEVDFTPISNRALLKPWIEEMTTALRQWEGNPHLKTTSYGRTIDDVIYRMPEIDLVERHEYSQQDPINTFSRNMGNLKSFGKPALYAELGISGDSPDGGLDKWGVHLHNGQWASLMTKGFGTSMNWWWDNYVDPLNLYPLFNGLTAYLKDENLAATHYQPERLATRTDKYSALIMRSDKRILGWVKSGTYSYQSLKEQYEAFLNAGKQKNGPFVPAYPAIDNASLTLDNIRPGAYKVEWWNTQGKGLIKTDRVEATTGSLTLPVPGFDQDLAFKLILLA